MVVSTHSIEKKCARVKMGEYLLPQLSWKKITQNVFEITTWIIAGDILPAEIHGDGKRFWRLIHLCMTDPLPTIIFQWRTVGSTLSSKKSQSTSLCSDDFIDGTRQGSISWISLWPVLKLETVSTKKIWENCVWKISPSWMASRFRCFTMKRNGTLSGLTF